MDAFDRFPELDAATVDGREYRFPRDFAGTLTIVALAFRVEHRDAIESWVPAIEAIVTSRAGVRGLALAILPAMMRFGRAALFGTMRKAMSEKQREVSAVAFTDVTRFIRALAISERDMSLILVDSEGTVLRRWAGRATPAATAELQSALASA